MNKKILSMLTIIMLFVGSVAGIPMAEAAPYDNYTSSINIEFSKNIMTKISEFGDDPATGNRSSGSPAELAAADYLVKTMNDIGLQNVTKEAATADGWTYKGASLICKDTNGKEQKIILGGYATDLVAANEQVPLVYLGEGTAADYTDIDVKGKLVLIDIDQINSWWINYPAYQAKLKGAKAVIAMSILAGENADRIGSQDICGPEDAPALAISQKDSLLLRNMIDASGAGEITVTLNANSVVTPKSTTYNVWGEIPGNTDDVIYMFGHYDGYYHSSFDDASGVATALGISKALIDSGYTPDKTIRVVLHGAEEWGKIDSAYDWSMGAYQQITTTHPEWAEKGFAIINIDGGFAVEGERQLGINTSHELAAFTKSSAEPIIQGTDYTLDWFMPASTGTEDLSWTMAGIPSIVAGEGEKSIYYDNYYHCNTDSIQAAGFDAGTFKLNHRLYGKILFDLDTCLIRPMDFATRFTALADSIDPAVINNPELSAAADKAIGAADKLTIKINKINADYTAAIAAGNDSDAKALQEQADTLNTELFKLYKSIQDDFLRISWGLDVIFPHENAQSNVAALTKTISSLQNGDIPTAYDEYLTSMDYAWYATAFDKETCDYFTAQVYDRSKGTWGDGRIANPACNVDDIVRSLAPKYEKENPDVSTEIIALKQELSNQQGYLTEIIAAEKTALAENTKIMEALTE